MGFVSLISLLLPNVGETIKTLTKKELQFADRKLEEANKYLKRRNIKFNLLRRNYYIISNADSCYAIIEDFQNKTKSNANSVQIKGGTAWGCQMFLLKYIAANHIMERKRVQPPLFAFAQCETKSKWFGVMMDVENSSITNIDWIPMKPKALSGTFAGIGIRSIADNGKKAIRMLAKDASFVTLKIPRPSIKAPYPQVVNTNLSPNQ